MFLILFPILLFCFQKIIKKKLKGKKKETPKCAQAQSQPYSHMGLRGGHCLPSDQAVPVDGFQVKICPQRQH